jgi:hypothetical protein
VYILEFEQEPLFELYSKTSIHHFSRDHAKRKINAAK